jgi:hypothetical protein
VRARDQRRRARLGSNASGRLGDGTTTTSSAIADVQGPTRTLVASAGSQHTCAVLASGGVVCWGAYGVPLGSLTPASFAGSSADRGGSTS